MKEQLSDEIKGVKKDVEEYVKSQIDFVKLHTAESISHLLAGLISSMVLMYLFFFVLLFISFTIAFWLKDVLNNNWLGFIIVAGFYLLAAILFLLFRKKLIEKPIIKAVIRLLFPNYTRYEK